MKKTLALCSLLLFGCQEQASSDKTVSIHGIEHFSKKGKLPSTFTKEKQEILRKTLNFVDKRDFEEAAKGFIAAPSYKKIMHENGKAVAWDMEKYEFLLKKGVDYDSIHPSLQRQAILNMAYGLYEVVPGKIYQVRGFDLANISFIKGRKGWIVFDPLTAKETAKAALDLINEKVEKRPVTAVVYSHSHLDHFGGVRGVVDEADVRSGKVKVIAPVGFMDHAVAENVYAGNAMIRRSNYQYGQILPASPFGHVDSSIGKAAAAGTTGLIEPNVIISKDIKEMTVDGIKMVFQNTPGTEAPAEMNTYFPEMKAFWAAENITNTVHNIYTLRGALVRDALAWSREINRALYMFGQEAEVMFASHSWPRWGNERIQEVMKGQRDIYAHLNNYVLHLANQGVTINQMHNEYVVPRSLQKSWFARSYHGSEKHNSRAVFNRYLGYWDGNPATLTPLSPEDSAPLYVEMMGGSKKIIKKALELNSKGKYYLSMEILNKLVYAEPKNQMAKDILADAFEQIGFSYESPSLRNSYLAAAKELREGVIPAATTKSGGPDMVRAMTTRMFLEYLSIKLDSVKADKLGYQFTLNIETPDNGEKFVVELSNSTMTVLDGYLAPKADLTLTLKRSDLEETMAGFKKFDTLIEEGKVKMKGDAEVLTKLKELLVDFDPFFEIMPGTKAMKQKDEDKDRPFKFKGEFPKGE